MTVLNDDFPIAARTWTPVTISDVTALRAQNIKSNAFIALQASTGAQPASTAGAVWLPPWEGIEADLTLAQRWPGVTGGVRVWAWSESAGTLSVSHA